MLLVTHELVNGRVVAAEARELVPLDVDMISTITVRRGSFYVPQEAIDDEPEDGEVGLLARAIAVALDRAGVSGRRVRMSHVPAEGGGRLYTWRIVNAWIRPQA
jgi:hypothetical protein